MIKMKTYKIKKNLSLRYWQVDKVQASNLENGHKHC